LGEFSETAATVTKEKVPETQLCQHAKAQLLLIVSIT